jgi:DmsE family decaheme c-type cytochrome
MKTLNSGIVLRGIGMQVNRLAAIGGLCLFGMLGSGWAAQPVGVALCVTCHDEDERPDISKTAHGFAADKRVPDCISCHGESDDHANNRKIPGVKGRPQPTRLFDKQSATPPNERSEACLTCHGKDASRAMWSGSQHNAANVPCSSCHKVHDNRDKIRVKASQAEVCYTCHKDQRTQMNKPSHHPVPEGKMVCSDCHNVHGSAGPKLLRRDTVNDTCYTCHAEKRGPFVHQHDPVAEDCGNCHTVHGSVVPSMLKTRAPLLCLQCHAPHTADSVGAIGGQNGVLTQAPGQAAPLITGTTSGKNAINFWQGRSCMNCHTQVHGSNNPSTVNPMPTLLMR